LEILTAAVVRPNSAHTAQQLLDSQIGRLAPFKNGFDNVRCERKLKNAPCVTLINLRELCDCVSALKLSARYLFRPTMDASGRFV
jgi:hypothetical protein